MTRIIDFFKDWWTRDETQEVLIRSDNTLVYAEVKDAEISVGDKGDGFEEQEIEFIADEIHVSRE